MAEFNGTIAVRHNPVASAAKYANVFTRAGGGAGYASPEMTGRAEDGFYRASFDLYESPEFLGDFLENGIGRAVYFYDDQGTSVWEGYVHDVELDLGRAAWRADISDMANAVWVRYRVRGTTTTLRSATQTDDISIAKYGRREFVLSAGELESTDIADDVATGYLNLHAYPKPAPVRVDPSAELLDLPVLSVGCRGWYDTLNWCVYNQTVSTDSQGAGAQIATVLADSNVAQFVAASVIEANDTSVSKEYDADRRGGDIMRDIARLGDAAGNRWITYMGEGRVFYYAQAQPPTEP